MLLALRFHVGGTPVFPLSWNRTVIASCPTCKRGRGCAGQNRCRCGVDTCHGFWAATTDAERITRWFTQHPDWQLGVPTGARSGLVVLDVDLDKGGLDSLIALQRAGLDISGTAVQLSGSGFVDSQNQPLYVKTLVDGHATFVDPNTGVVAWRDPHPEVHAAPDAPA